MIFEKWEEGAVTKLKAFVKSPVFWIGIAFRLIGFWYLARHYKDFNDMNELVLYGVQNLFRGKPPYSQTYVLTIWTRSYDYYLGYPPGVLLIYAPVILYPVMWGHMQFSIVQVTMNIIFDYLVVSIFYYPKRTFRVSLAYLYWVIPFWGYVDACSFNSVMYLLVVLAIVHIDEPFKSGLALGTLISVYHMYVFIVPAIVIYQIQDHGPYDGSRFLMPLKRLNFKQIFEFLKGSAIPLGVVGLFALWDWDGMKYSLWEASADRFDLGDWQKIIIILSFASALAVPFFKHRFSATFTVSFIGAIMISLEAFLMYFSTIELAHYFGLIVPLGWLVAYFVSEYFPDFDVETKSWSKRNPNVE